jgi:hypothetical protein
MSTRPCIVYPMGSNDCLYALFVNLDNITAYDSPRSF